METKKCDITDYVFLLSNHSLFTKEEAIIFARKNNNLFVRIAVISRDDLDAEEIIRLAAEFDHYVIWNIVLAKIKVFLWFYGAKEKVFPVLKEIKSQKAVQFYSLREDVTKEESENLFREIGCESIKKDVSALVEFARIVKQGKKIDDRFLKLGDAPKEDFDAASFFILLGAGCCG